MDKMLEYSYIKRALLRELGENARESTTTLAKKLKCSRNTVLSNIKSLEREFDLLYTIEFDREAMLLNYVQLWCIKFGKKPKSSELKKIFKEDYQVRLVAETEGDFDLFINMATDSGRNYVNWSLRTALKLIPFIPKIMPSAVAMSHTGFFPIQNEMLARLDLSHLGLDKTDNRILIELNNNSRTSYAIIAKRLGVDVETVRYRMKRMMRHKIIKRFTAVARRPPNDYNIVFFANYELAPGIVERYDEAKDYYTGVDGKLPLFNSFQYLALLSGSHLLFRLGCFESEEAAIRQAVIEHKEIYKEDNPEVSYAKITKVIKGNIPVRNIDMAKDYRAINWSDGK
jgi:DNA-binding Lrp family transcriptional regulator